MKMRKKCLTNAAKRTSITLGIVIIVIRIPYKNRYIQCSTPEEAVAVMQHLAEEEAKRREFTRLDTWPKDAVDEVLRERDNFYETIEVSAWTRESFWKFLDSIGDSQKRLLTLLVRNHAQSDEVLRKALNIDSNQALAGVLSGISKQAGILNISARAVYVVEDERRAGELHKTYFAADDFLRICREMNWPEEWPDRKENDATAMSKQRAKTKTR